MKEISSAAIAAVASVSANVAPAPSSSFRPNRVTPAPNTSAPFSTRVRGWSDDRHTVRSPVPFFTKTASAAPSAAVKSWSMARPNPFVSTVSPRDVSRPTQPLRNGTAAVALPFGASVPPSPTRDMHGSPETGAAP